MDLGHRGAAPRQQGTVGPRRLVPVLHQRSLALDWVDPLGAPALRGNGAKAWFGWPDDPKVEALRDRWVDATDEAERRTLCAQIQAQVFENASFAPLGNYRQSTAWRSRLSGLIEAPLPVFWNVTKS